MTCFQCTSVGMCISSNNIYSSLHRRCEKEPWISGNEDAAASNKGHDEHSADEGSSRTGNSSDESLEEENEDSGDEDWSDESSEDGGYESSFMASGDDLYTTSDESQFFPSDCSTEDSTSDGDSGISLLELDQMLQSGGDGHGGLVLRSSARAPGDR
ncbi:hypothetical protein DM02DRAFT_678283 [Periconia macrospinosa]|uniref:Uncharacterized protein n=1 Tax=Periconia macrospinosa TaxID=97972 RepID=A0A2V1D083_9PLEO|nr:hypothetical protein DM02DRAFT_678283 [Periconia macrospinosa]